MNRPLVWLFGALFLVGALGASAFAMGYGLSRQHQPPEQPIRFPHQWHVESAGVDCLFCHRTASAGVSGGLPAVDQCMFCHQVAGRESTEVKKLLVAYQDRQPINWVHVYRVPDHVRFPHGPHYQTGIDCSDCHGDVKNTTLLTQVQQMKMGFCLTCHRRMNAPTDCWTCHY